MEQTDDFTVIAGSRFITLTLNPSPSVAGVSRLVASVIEKLVPGVAGVLVECRELHELSTHVQRSLTQLLSQLKAAGAVVVLLEPNASVRSTVESQALGRVLKSAATRAQALAHLGVETPKALDVQFINPFLEATSEVLKVQCQTEAKPQRLAIRSPKDRFQGDISGVIAISAESFCGSIVISFPQATFLGVMSRMLGTEFKEMSSDLEDGAAELTNIIFGNARRTLNTMGYGIGTAIPSVVMGQNHSVRIAAQGPRVAIPFETDLGPFTIEICIGSDGSRL